MMNNLNHSFLRNRQLLIIPVLAIFLGISLRTINLQLKPYWGDETFTLLRASGYTVEEAVENLYNGEIISVDDVLRYQRPSGSTSNINGTISGLIAEEPQHPPLYFVLNRIWAEIFGNSKTAMRSLAVVCSLLGFPALYWLCWELFASPSVAIWAMAFYAVSPTAIRYAQEVRQYSLWLTLILVASATLLRAMRNFKWWNWLIYSLSLALGIYCHLLTGLIIVAHGIYVVIAEKFQVKKRVIFFIYAVFISLFLASPWLLNVSQNRSVVAQTTDYLKDALPLNSLIQSWLIFLGRTLIAGHARYNTILLIAAIPVVGLIGYSLYFLCRHARPQAWIFLFSLMGTLFMPFLLLDLFTGGQRTAYDRYFLPCYAGLYVSLAYLFTTKTNAVFLKQSQRQLWQWIAVTTLSISLLFSSFSVFAPTWWSWSEFDVEISRRINAESPALVVSDIRFYGILALTHELSPETQLLLVQTPSTLNLPAEIGKTFLYNPSQDFVTLLQQQGKQLELIYQFKDELTEFSVPFYTIEN